MRILWNIDTSMVMTSTSEEEYPVHFRKPDHIPELSDKANLSLAMGAMASRLVGELRTRTYHPDGRRENVAEHALMLVKVSAYLAKEFYPGMLDAGVVAIKAASHDDVEAYVLDTATDRITDDERVQKDKKEAFGLRVLQREYADVSPTYVQDVTSYEEQEALEDKFVKLVDKIMVLLIHIPNNGASLLENYTYEEYLARTQSEDARLRAKYPHFTEIVDLRTELALYIGKKTYEPSA